MSITNRIGLGRNLTAAEVDANFAFVSHPSGKLRLNITANGAIDQGPLINAAIAELLAVTPVGGELLLPIGDMGIATPIDLPTGVTLVGTGSPLLGTTGTRLKALADVSLVRSIGASIVSRVLTNGLRQIGLWGYGHGGDTQPLLDIRNTSYFRADRCSAGNTIARALWIRGGWDCRFNDLEVTYAGATNGSVAAIDLDSPVSGTYEYTNQIFFNQLRMEQCFGVAFATSGANTNEIFITDAKLEGIQLTSGVPAMKLIGASNVSLQNVQFTVGGSVALPAVLQIIGSSTVKGRVTMERVGSALTLASYISVATSTHINLDLGISPGAGPEPTGGYIVSWDHADPGNFAIHVQSNLSAPDYNYNNGSQLSPIDSSGTGTTISNGGTYVVPGRISAVWLDNVATVAGFTITLPAGGELESGQEISFFTTSAITTLTIGGGTVLGGPSTLAAGGFFTLRYVGLVSKWIRFA